MTPSLNIHFDRRTLITMFLYLARATANGHLRLVRGDDITADLYLEEGRIVYLELNGDVAEPTTTLADILRWKNGDLYFYEDAEIPDHTCRIYLENVLASERPEKERLASSTLNIDSVLKAREVSESDQTLRVGVKAMQLLMLLDGETSLQDLANKLEQNPDTLLGLARELSAAGVVEETGERIVGRETLDELTDAVVDAMGPIAEILVEDMIEDLGYTWDSLPQQALPTLTDRLQARISNDEWREQFRDRVEKLY